ncbi:hypothetical protein [Pseudooceanicola sp. LIPI14-2-Ac024]|uniref:hypothetical protein n=1 Tax=Pseudooceanicola sp. LIPI14-2-Ac024 TaxID=3344875 RepID=UPI0035CEB654
MSGPDEREQRYAFTQRIVFLSLMLAVSVSMAVVAFWAFDRALSRGEAQRELANELLQSVASEYGKALYAVDRLVECRCGDGSCEAENARADSTLEMLLSNQLVRTLEIASVTGNENFSSEYQSLVSNLADLRSGLIPPGDADVCRYEKDVASDLRVRATDLLTFFAN